MPQNKEIAKTILTVGLHSAITPDVMECYEEAKQLGLTVEDFIDITVDVMGAIFSLIATEES